MPQTNLFLRHLLANPRIRYVHIVHQEWVVTAHAEDAPLVQDQLEELCRQYPQERVNLWLSTQQITPALPT